MTKIAASIGPMEYGDSAQLVRYDEDLAGRSCSDATSSVPERGRERAFSIWKVATDAG